MALNKYDTENYIIETLDQEQIDMLKSYGVQAAASESVIPNVYGIRNKETDVVEFYTSNLASALSVQNSLEEGIKDELKQRPKTKGNLRIM